MVLLHYGLTVLVLLTGLAIHVEGRDCEADQWQCDKGECIPAPFKCDGGSPDCDDGRDESTSACGEDCASVKGGGFACADGQQCVCVF